MGSVIKISTKLDWGTCFKVNGSNGLSFVSAAHVFKSCGIPLGQDHGVFQMCDSTTDYANGPQTFTIQNIVWDVGCDLVWFDCDFPSTPFMSGAYAGSVQVQALGYLNRSGNQPSCNDLECLLGEVKSVGKGKNCARDRLSLDFKTPVRDLNGMSGGPIVDINTGHAIAVMGGSSRLAGGPPYVGTAIQ